MSMKRAPDQDDGIQNLIQRLDSRLNMSTGGILTFISARAGEGTSTIARDVAVALADSLDHEVLLIDAGKIDDAFYHEHNATPTLAIADMVAKGKPAQNAIYTLSPKASFGRWANKGRGRNEAAKLLKDNTFWDNLRSHFSTILIDAPSLKESADGIGLAARADATVIVVEAEATRQPVIENLRDTLIDAGAKISGIVMNKRRYYIPARIYQNM